MLCGDAGSLDKDRPMAIRYPNGRPLIDGILFYSPAARVSDCGSTAGLFDDLGNGQVRVHNDSSNGFKFQFQDRLIPDRIYFPVLCC